MAGPAEQLPVKDVVGYLATRSMKVRLHVAIGTPLFVPAYSSSFPLVALELLVNTASLHSFEIV